MSLTAAFAAGDREAGRVEQAEPDQDGDLVRVDVAVHHDAGAPSLIITPPEGGAVGAVLVQV
jgi:hypothetical protein